MKIKKDKMFVSIVDETLTEAVERERVRTNLELALFALPEFLDGGSEKYVGKVADFKKKNRIRLALHGPFIDLAFHSRDKKIAEVTRERYLRAIEIARRLGAVYLVLHSTYNPYIANPTYFDRWLAKSLEFWPEILEIAASNDVRLVLENIWDDRPDYMKELLACLDSQALKVCLDLGHLSLFSKASYKDWFDVFGDDILVMHIHNNHGKYDDHLALDDGEFDYGDFIGWVQKNGYDPIYTLEVSKKEYVKTSRKFLKKNRFL